MLNSAQAMRLRMAVFPRIVDANTTIVGFSYVAAYATLERYGTNKLPDAVARVPLDLCQP